VLLKCLIGVVFTTQSQVEKWRNVVPSAFVHTQDFEETVAMLVARQIKLLELQKRGAIGKSLSPKSFIIFDCVSRAAANVGPDKKRTLAHLAEMEILTFVRTPESFEGLILMTPTAWELSRAISNIDQPVTSTSQSHVLREAD